MIMLRSLKDLEQYAVSATDGPIGSVVNFLFDDERWITRYIVVNTGGFLNAAPQVLIAPISFRGIDWPTRHINLALTIEKIKNSPNVDTDKPVSRQHELDHYLYYGYPYYWGVGGVAGLGAYPGMLTAGLPTRLPEEPPEKAPSDRHLRSVNELRGYHVQGSDGAIGSVADFIVDDASWEVRYLVVDTSNWWFGKKVLVAPQWVSRISWSERAARIDMPREAIKNSPEWNQLASVTRDYEARLYDHYRRPAYWGHATLPNVPDVGLPH
jgi:hypothetical protein